TRALADDKSGTTLADRLTAAGHKLAAREIVTDDVEAIRGVVRRWIADAGVDVVITTGGTGFTGRDVTPEAIEPLFEKRMDGFSIAFHMLSHAKIGASTIQSRAIAGVAGATFIFCLPGSPGACRDGWDGILAALAREANALLGQRTSDPEPARLLLQKQQPQFRDLIRTLHQEDRADRLAVHFRDPAMFARGIVGLDELGADLGDQRLETDVP